MTTDTGGAVGFFRAYGATAVGPTPPQPNIPPDGHGADAESARTVNLAVEYAPEQWRALPAGAGQARPGEYPERFVDGCQSGQPVVCVRAPAGWPIPLYLAEVGAVALEAAGRRFERTFARVERVLSFVADPFPWDQVEGLAADLSRRPEFRLRVLVANRPREQHSPFDYEVMRTQARARAMEEMTNLERLALAIAHDRPTLVDGQLDRITGEPPAGAPLLVGVLKSHASSYFEGFDRGWQTLLNLAPGERTPVFGIAAEGRLSVATWYLKLAGESPLAPNWGYVRVEVPWAQFEKTLGGDFGFVDRLSRWLVEARCRAASYARMPVSLEPIVRAEDGLKPLFTPFPVLVNRLYRTAGLFRRGES